MTEINIIVNNITYVFDVDKDTEKYVFDIDNNTITQRLKSDVAGDLNTPSIRYKVPKDLMKTKEQLLEEK